MSALLAALLEHYDVLKEQLRRRFGDRDLAADVMQDLSVRVLENHAHADADLRTPAYLLKHMGHQLAIDRYRSDASRSRLIVATDTPPERAAVDAGPEAQAISAQTGAALLAAVQALPERCREAFILVRLYDMPQADAAKTLGISRGMVARHVANAQQALKPILDIHSAPDATRSK